ncbi:hypothetical protein MRB53_003405 [Persea americana]|uniref:Uncharacterized protein n=1 Tax=Persea americana TaxID=3435 RepID=A0ACC2MX42_PERAE|nr:hypothetical protein MRB53_003405 [Persea americana]
MGSCRRNFKPIIAIIFFLLINSSAATARPLEGLIALESLQKGHETPSGRSGCTYVPKNPGPRCPINERNFAVHATVVEPGSHDTIINSGVAFADTEIRDQHQGS